MRELSRNISWLIGAVFLACTLAAIPGQAQYRAGLQGTVTDPQGRPVPGALVTLTNKETSATRTAKTTAESTLSPV